MIQYIVYVFIYNLFSQSVVKSKFYDNSNVYK